MSMKTLRVIWVCSLVVLMMMFLSLLLFSTARAVVVTVLCPFCELLQQQLDKKTQHDGCGNLEMNTWRYETIGFIT